MNDTAVTLSTSTPGTITAEQALQACEAVREGLVPINPDVTVEIRDVDTLLAASPAGGVCAAA